MDIHFAYQEDYFQSCFIKNIAGHFLCVLKDFSDKLLSLPYNYDLLTEAERHQQLVD